VLEEAARTIGAGDLASIRYVGSGFNFALGQNYTPQDPWPRFRLERYDRLVDYENQASREELVRTQAESPPHGGGSQPLIGVQQQIFWVSGPYAWNQTGTLPSLPEKGSGLVPLPSDVPGNASAAPAAAADRRLAIWLTPHGFLKAALAHNPTARLQTLRRRQVIIVSFSLEDGTEVNGTINDQNLVERVETRIPNPVLGDMPVDVAYLNYRDFDGVRFPTHILQRQGGFHTLEVTVSDVAANPSDRIEVPEQARVAAAPPAFVEAQPIAEGLWLLAGGSHNSVAVELRDYVVVIEAPQNEERSLAVIAKIRELVPGKTIRYLINTHHHFDHSGGMRTYAAEGATIITHEFNRRFYDLVFAGERKLRPDRLSQRSVQPSTEAVADRHILRNGSRAIQIHLVEGNLHDAGLLMVYFPAERLLVEADAFTPGPPNAPPPAEPSPFAVNLYENVVRLKLDVAQIAPIHGRVVPWSELLKAIGKLSQPPPAGVLRAESDPRP